MTYTGDLIPNWLHEEVRQVMETDYFQDTADIFISERLSDGKGGQLPPSFVKIAENVPCTVRHAQAGEERRIGESQTETPTFRFEFPLQITWLSGSYTLVSTAMRIVYGGRNYEVAEQLNPKTYGTSQAVLAVKR